MQFVDRTLARRLESAEEMPQVLYTQYCMQHRPEIGAALEPIAGGHAMFAGIGSPIGHAAGLGFDGPVTEAELDRLEDFYRSHGAPAQVDYCPHTDPSLLELCRKRGYIMAELNNVLGRPLRRGEPLPKVAPGIGIRPGSTDEAPQLAAIVERCFFPDGGAPEGFDGILTPMFQLHGALLYVGSVNGQKVACGSGLILPQFGVLGLYGAGTLTEYRGRGLQTALLQHRMHAAAEAGCELAVIVTLGGTTSQHNAERLGFTVAYSKATLVKNW
jgi:GNAT superfamily N-acetyltransferase